MGHKELIDDSLLLVEAIARWLSLTISSRETASLKIHLPTAMLYFFNRLRERFPVWSTCLCICLGWNINEDVMSLDNPSNENTLLFIYVFIPFECQYLFHNII